MKEWDWAEGRRKDSGTGAAFLEDVRVGTASPKTSVAAGAGAGGMPVGLEGVLKKEVHRGDLKPSALKEQQL